MNKVNVMCNRSNRNTRKYEIISRTTRISINLPNDESIVSYRINVDQICFLIKVMIDLYNISPPRFYCNHCQMERAFRFIIITGPYNIMSFKIHRLKNNIF